MFEKINALVDVFLNKKNLKDKKQRENIERIWEKTIERKIQKNTTILKYEKGELLIKAKNPAWKMELSLLKESIKKKLTKKKK